MLSAVFTSSCVIHEPNCSARHHSLSNPVQKAERLLPPLSAAPGPRVPRPPQAGGAAGAGSGSGQRPQRGGRAAARSGERGAGAPGPALTLSESRSGSAWQRRKRKDLGSLQSVWRVVRKQVPPTFSRTHLPGPAPGRGAELQRRQGPPAPRPPAGGTGNSQWFSAAILATAGRGRPGCRAPAAPPTGRGAGNSALLLLFSPDAFRAEGPACAPRAPRPAEGREGGRAEPYMPLLQTTKHK